MTQTLHTWPVLIGFLLKLRQQGQAVDEEELWEWDIPGLAATDEQVAALEASLGERLPSDYREFLLHVNGWPNFFQEHSLASVSDLVDSALTAVPRARLHQVDDLATRARPIAPDDLLPVAWTEDTTDVISLIRASGPAPGVVIWTGEGLIDEWPDFRAFFLSFIEYTRREISALVADSQA